MLSMRALRESVKPYAYQSLGRVLPQFIGIAISSIIVKSAGIDVFGQYSLLLAVVTVIFSVVGAALDTDFQRTCNASNVYSVLSTKLVIWVVLIPALGAIAWIADFGWLAMLFVALGFLLKQSVETRITQDRILGDDKRAILPRLLPVIVFMVLLLIADLNSLFNVAFLFALAWLTGLLFVWPLVRGIKIHVGSSFQQLRNISPLWFSLILTQVYGNIDLYVIRMFHGDEVVGTYKAAYMFAAMAIPIAGVFSYIFLSRISTAVQEQDFDSAKTALFNQLLICGGLGVGLIVFMIFLFPFVAKVLYGSHGGTMVLPARILAIAMALNMLTMVFSYALLALRMEKVIAVMTAMGALIYLALGMPLIQSYGSEGAGAAMAITYCALLMAYSWVYKRKFIYERQRAFDMLGDISDTQIAVRRN